MENTMIQRLLAVVEGYQEDAFETAARSSLIGAEYVVNPYDDDSVSYDGETVDKWEEDTRVDTVKIPNTRDRVWALGYDVVDLLVDYMNAEAN